MLESKTEYEKLNMNYEKPVDTQCGQVHTFYQWY